jgi:hypothetical protein
MDLHRETFTVNGEFLGQRLFLPTLKGKGLYEKLVLSSLFYCGYCGDLWGRRAIIPAPGYRTEFFAHRYTCESCGDGRLLSVGGGGPDLLNHSLADFPLAVLQREIAMYAQMYENPATTYWIGGIPHATNPYLQEKRQ